MFEDVVPLQVEEQETLVEVMTLHSGRGVQLGQGVVGLFLLKFVDVENADVIRCHSNKT